METGEIVLCTVEKILGTTVFVRIDEDGEGTIVFSEIAPGRIRNIRDYVVPNKKIVCKIIRIDSSGAINLSLRRVTSKEKKELMDRYKKEKTCLSILKIIAKEKAIEIFEKIKKDNKDIIEIFEQCKENPKILEKYLTKEQTINLVKILSEKKEKLKEVKRNFFLTCKKPEGVEIIKKILIPYNENIVYFGAGKFRISFSAKDYKEAEKEIDKILANIEEKAEKEKCEFGQEK